MKQILIVDDSSSMRQMVRIALSSGPYMVSEAKDGEEALTLLKSQRFHLVISDVNMPRLDGIELLRRMKSDNELKFMPVLMLTTEGDEKRKAEGRAAGAKAWMVKPFKTDKLLMAVSQLVA